MPADARHLIPLFAALAVVAVAGGCSSDADSDDADTDADVAPIIHASVHVVDTSPDKGVDVEPTFLSAPRAQFPELETYARNDVLVSAQGDVFVRRVRGTHVDGDRVVVDTEAGSLTDIFEQVRLRGSVLHPSTPATPGPAVGLAKLDIGDRHIPLGGGSEIEILEGSISFQPQLDFDLTMRRGKLDHLKLAATGEIDGALRVRYDIHRPRTDGTLPSPNPPRSIPSRIISQFSALNYSSIPVVKLPPVHVICWAGSIPVVVAVSASLTAGWNIEVAGDVTGVQSVNANGSVSAGLEYINGDWRDIESSSLSITGDLPTVERHVLRGDVTLTARLDISFYDIVGPYVSLQSYAGVGNAGSEADFAADGWFGEAGLRAYAGAEVGAFGQTIYPYSKLLFDKSTQTPF